MADQSTSSQEVFGLLQTYLTTISKFSKTFIPFAKEVKDELFLPKDKDGNESGSDIIDEDILPTDPRYETVKAVGGALQSAIDTLHQLRNIQEMLQNPQRIKASGGTGRLTLWHGKLVESFSDSVVQHIRGLSNDQKRRIPEPWAKDFEENALEPVKVAWDKSRRALEDLQKYISGSRAGAGPVEGPKSCSPHSQGTGAQSIFDSLHPSGYEVATVGSSLTPSGPNVASLYAGTLKRQRSISVSPTGGEETKRPRSESFEMSLHANLLQDPSLHSGENTPAMGDSIKMEEHARALASALRFELQMEWIDDV
jgi:hypothetical protein